MSYGTHLQVLGIHYKHSCAQRTNTLAKTQINIVGMYIDSCHGDMNVQSILSSTCNKTKVCTQHGFSSCKHKQNVNNSFSMQTRCRMVPCDGRWVFVTDLLHLFPKTACLLLKMLQCAWWGERARMGKMCLHGPWEIPPLFVITVTFQHSKVFVIPAKESCNYLIAERKMTQKGAEEIPLSRRSD